MSIPVEFEDLGDVAGRTIYSGGSAEKVILDRSLFEGYSGETIDEIFREAVEKKDPLAIEVSAHELYHVVTAGKELLNDLRLMEGAAYLYGKLVKNAVIGEGENFLERAAEEIIEEAYADLERDKDRVLRYMLPALYLLYYMPAKNPFEFLLGDVPGYGSLESFIEAYSDAS